jgi:hypothetical protein
VFLSKVEKRMEQKNKMMDKDSQDFQQEDLMAGIKKSIKKQNFFRKKESNKMVS